MGHPPYFIRLWRYLISPLSVGGRKSKYVSSLRRPVKRRHRGSMRQCRWEGFGCSPHDGRRRGKNLGLFLRHGASTRRTGVE